MSANPPSSDERDPVEILAEEFSERHRRGEQPTVAEYVERYPEHADAIEDLFPMLLMMEKARTDNDSTPTAVEPPVGLERLGEYVIARELGRGGMGVVYEAHHERLARRVALKVLPEKAAVMSPRKLERFQREAQAAARLHHTNIVPVFEVGCDQDLHYYAMQHIDGRALDQLIIEMRDSRRSDFLCGTEVAVHTQVYYHRVAEIGIQLAGALAYAHAAGTLHRDIKPGNVLIDAAGVAWLADFGLAKFDESTLDLTATGAVLGTLRYMSPEQRRGEPTHSSDIYSLGVTLRELATLVRVHDDPTQAAPTPRLPRDLETILQKAAHEEPTQRYTTASALAADLRRFQDDQPILARRAGLWERTRRWCRRNPALAAASCIAVIAVLVAATSGWTGYVNTRDALHLESVQKTAAQKARKRAEENVQLSLTALEKIFDALEPVSGEARRRNGLGRPGGAPGRRGPGGRGGSNERRGGPPIEQEKLLLQAILSFFDELTRKNSSDPALQVAAAHAYQRVANLQTNLGESVAAQQSSARAVDLFEQLLARYPENDAYRVEWIEAKLRTIATTDTPTAIAARDRELKHLSGELTKLGAHSEADLLQVQLLISGGVLEVARGNVDAAEAQYADALRRCEQLLALRPPRRGAIQLFGETLRVYGEFLREEKQHERALDLFDAIEFSLSDRKAAHPRALHARAMIHQEKALVYEEIGDWSAADKARDDGRRLLREGGPLRPLSPRGRPGQRRRGPG
ncbi:MAG: serine/threonine-protein kinase [Planctomycetota bacterium]